MPGTAQVSVALSGLVDTCRDGELGFHAAAAGSEAAQMMAGGRDAGAAGEEAGTVTLSDLARRDAEAEAAYRDALGRGLPGHAISTIGRQYEQVVDARKHLSLLERSLLPVA